MEKRGNDIISLINKAIDASIDFEELMDSIDFNSYLLEEDEDKKVKETEGYKKYECSIRKASGYCENIIDEEIIDEIKNIKQFDVSQLKDEKLTQYLICQLFEAKKIRHNARKKTQRKEEKKLYTNAAHKLHKAFYLISSDKFFPQKDNKLTVNFNWAKVLYYNELAICSSGLAESSLSLGYAEKTINLLEELYSELKNIGYEERNSDIRNDIKDRKDIKDTIKKKKKPFTFSQILKLYTFALYNQGEAERLLHNEDLALRTFMRIIRIYEDKNLTKEKSSDYYSALLRMASILIDMGRGAEAKKSLDKIKNGVHDDYRAVDARLEKASALIDKKEYENAYKQLDDFRNSEWNNTFAQRKAEVYILRLWNEFIKNRTEDLGKAIARNSIKLVTGNQESLEFADILVSKEYQKYKGSADKILDVLLPETISRQDGGNYKKICAYLAEYFKKQYKSNNENENLEIALLYFYLYLFNEHYFDNDDISSMKLRNGFKEKVIPIIKEKNVSKLIKYAIKEKKIEFQTLLDNVEEESYMEGFFDLYVCLEEENKDKFIEIEKDVLEKIVKKLEERLIDIYMQKDKDIELERVKERYERFREKALKKKKRYWAKGKPEKFLEDFFFKNKDCMKAESIIDQMKRNTEDFVKKVVGKSKIHDVKKGEVKGTLSVLRRWNSFTPALSSSVNPSKGGGYFIHFSYNNESLGIVIDPGYDFLENFFSQGFKIGDIDIVLVSHAHPDHTDNLPSILSLFIEMNGRLGKYHYKSKRNKKNLTLILSPGVFERYTRIIKSSEEVLKDIIVVHVKGKAKKKAYEFTSKDKKIKIVIKAFGTSHQDLSQFQSLGFKIIVNEIYDKVSKPEKITVIGYTGDAKWDYSNRKWSNYMNDCDIICAH